MRVLLLMTAVVAGVENSEDFEARADMIFSWEQRRLSMDDVVSLGGPHDRVCFGGRPEDVLPPCCDRDGGRNCFGVTKPAGVVL